MRVTVMMVMLAAVAGCTSSSPPLDCAPTACVQTQDACDLGEVSGLVEVCPDSVQPGAECVTVKKHVSGAVTVCCVTTVNPPPDAGDAGGGGTGGTTHASSSTNSSSSKSSSSAGGTGGKGSGGAGGV